MLGRVEIDDVVRAGALGSGHRVYFHAAIAFDLCGDDCCQFLGCAIHGAPLSWKLLPRALVRDSTDSVKRSRLVAQALLPVRCVCATVAKGAQARVPLPGV